MRAYLDHASASPLRPGVIDAMVPWLDAADPGRVHTEGRMARVALEDARSELAGAFGTRPRQVIFTSGATEAINAAVYGAMASGRGDHAVVPEVEHAAVRDASVRSAARVTWIGVDGTGLLDAAEIVAGIDSGTALVHCQWANQEVGTIQPVAEVVAACRDRGVLVHVDAASAAGRLDIDFDSLGADLLSVSSAKLGGPRGAGALLVRRGLRVPPLLVGGSQERARRAGLENVAAMVGFAAAAGALVKPDGIAAESIRAAAQTDRLRQAATASAGVTVFGPLAPADRLPHLLCVGVDGVEAEGVLLGLDQAGVAAHSGSACSSELLEPSAVLAAMGVPAERSLRLSVGWSTTDSDIDLAVAALPRVIARLRALAGSL